MKDDTISRAAALTALGEEPPVWHDGEDEIAERNQWRRDVAAIKALPPAADTNVGDTDTISRQAAINTMMAAKTVDPSIVGCASNAGVDWCIDAIKALPSAQPGWIPTLDKIPDITDTYIVMVGINECGEGMHTEVRTADWNKVYKTWNVHESEKSIVGEVTAWMSSPTPYREGGQRNA